MNNGRPKPTESGYSIRQCFPPDGEWFEVQFVYDHPNVPSVFLSRVILWALVAAPGEIERVEAIGETGTPRAALGSQWNGDSYYVKASDTSPAGVPWAELYAEATPNRMNVREVVGDHATAFM